MRITNRWLETPSNKFHHVKDNNMGVLVSESTAGGGCHCRVEDRSPPTRPFPSSVGGGRTQRRL